MNNPTLNVVAEIRCGGTMVRAWTNEEILDGPKMTTAMVEQLTDANYGDPTSETIKLGTADAIWRVYGAPLAKLQEELEAIEKELNPPGPTDEEIFKEISS